MCGLSTTSSHQKKMRIYVEVDAVRLCSSGRGGVGGGAASEVTILSGLLDISDDLFMRATVDLSRASVHINAQGYAQCRFPYIHYTICNIVSTEQPTSSDDNLSKNWKEFYAMYNNAVHTQLKCRFCSTDLLQNSDCIKYCRPLPTGLLDNVGYVSFSLDFPVHVEKYIYIYICTMSLL